MKRALLILPLLACSGGSGVDGGLALTSLSDADYVKVCTYYNTKAAQINMGAKCSSNNQQPNVALLPCGSMNDTRSYGGCSAKVEDAENCINSLDACKATAADNLPQGCVLLGNCHH